MSIYEKDLKKKNIRKKDERNEINNDLFSNFNNTFGGFFGDNNFFNLRPVQTERNLSKKRIIILMKMLKWKKKNQMK